MPVRLNQHVRLKPIILHTEQHLRVRVAVRQLHLTPTRLTHSRREVLAPDRTRYPIVVQNLALAERATLTAALQILWRQVVVRRRAASQLLHLVG